MSLVSKAKEKERSRQSRWGCLWKEGVNEAITCQNEDLVHLHMINRDTTVKSLKLGSPMVDEFL